MRFWYKRSFEKACRRHPPQTQRLIAEALFQVKVWYQIQQAPVGLRIKKLYQGPNGKVFEARVSLDLRLIWVEHQETVWFSIVGSHEVVQRFIRSFR